MKKIKLTKGMETLVDNDIFLLVRNKKWYFNGRYATRDEKNYKNRRMRKCIYLHRLIMDVVDEKRDVCVDHIDNNPLNNQRQNLRICNHSENLFNSKLNKNNRSGYKGVSFSNEKKRWTMHVGTKNYGYFNNKIEAAKAYNKIAKELVGEFAKTNF